MDAQLLAPPSVDDAADQAPRTSTPLGPHPMSPEKKPPTPIEGIRPRSNEASVLTTNAPERPSSAASSATERPVAPSGLGMGHPFPPKPPSIDSNFSSVQGKTAGTPPDADDDSVVDAETGSYTEQDGKPDPAQRYTGEESSRQYTEEQNEDGVADNVSDSSVWDESQHLTADQAQEASSNAQAAKSDQGITAATQPVKQEAPAAVSDRPDWMTDELDESWPDEVLVPAQPPSTASLPQSDTAATVTPVAAPDTSLTEFQSMDAAGPPSSDHAGRVSSETPSSRAFFEANEPQTMASSRDAASTAATPLARRAMLGSRPPAQPLREVQRDTNLQAGPSTPSMRLPSHLQGRSRLSRVSIVDEDSDSSIWSGSESDGGSTASAPDDFASARGSLVENTRVANLQHTRAETRSHSRTETQHTQTEKDPQTRAETIGSPGALSQSSDVPAGTFIHRADVSSLPPVLRPAWQSPAKGQNGAGNRKVMAAIGGDMFTPMRLQTMFKTPTPPEGPPTTIMQMLSNGNRQPDFTKAIDNKGAQQAAVQQSGEAPKHVSGPPRETVPATLSTGIEATEGVPSAARAMPKIAQPIVSAVPTSAFTFHSPRLAQSSLGKGVDGMVPSQSLQNLQTATGTTLQVRTSSRPASAAANLGVYSPAVIGATSQLVSGPPTPHTPMRLFKFNYDDAATRAKLEQMVNENSPAAKNRVEHERERKRLRLDVRPRKVVTGDLMEMPNLAVQPTRAEHVQASQPPHANAVAVTASPQRAPPVDYVKESTDFMSALQQMVRNNTSNSSSNTDTSREWVTDEDEGAGASQASLSASGSTASIDTLSPSRSRRGASQDYGGVSFHQGSVEPSSLRQASSPVRLRRSPLRQSTRPEVAVRAYDLAVSQSPERLSTRKLPADSSLYGVDPSLEDFPMSSTLKSRPSLSRSLARRTALETVESPRKLLRRISAAAIAEDEVSQEFEDEAAGNGAWADWLPSDALSQRDRQIRELEERIARRRLDRQISQQTDDYGEVVTTTLPNHVDSAGHQYLHQQPPQLITLHEPTLDRIASAQGHNDRNHRHEMADDSISWDDLEAELQVAGNPGLDVTTRRFQDGIVLYDSERIAAPPQHDPTRTLRHIASDIEMRNRGPNGLPSKQATLLALPTQPTSLADLAPSSQPRSQPPVGRRSDRTASSNTLVDSIGGRTVSGEVASHASAISDLGGKGATITRTGSLFNISQIPEQELQNLGGGKLTFNKELNKWEKVPRSRSSHEDLRSAASSRNGRDNGLDRAAAPPTSKTPVPVIPEASVEASRDEDVFSDTPAEQEARSQPGARANAFQQRLSNLSATNLSDSTDPFQGMESFGQSSQENNADGNVNVGQSIEEMLERGGGREAEKRSRRATAVAADSYQEMQDQPTVAATHDENKMDASSSTDRRAPPASGPTSTQLTSRTPPTRGAGSNLPRSGSSLRHVVTYSPESTTSSHHSHRSGGSQTSNVTRAAPPMDQDSKKRGIDAVTQTGLLEKVDRFDTSVPRRGRAIDDRDSRIAQVGRGVASTLATPVRAGRSQAQPMRNPMTPTPIASASSVSTPKSILKQPGMFRGVDARASFNASNAAVAGTPNRTISFVDPPTRKNNATRPRTFDSGGVGSHFEPGKARVYGHEQAEEIDAEGDDDEETEDDVTGERTHAISSALRALAELTLGGDDTQLGNASKTNTLTRLRDARANRSHWSYRTLRRPRQTHHNRHGDLDDADDSNHHLEGHGDEQTEEYDELHGYPDMTLLTDASFNFAHDKVLEAITDVEPWEPGWDELQAIDLSRRRLESCVRLKEFLPALEELDLHDNELSYLTGIPTSVRVLNVAGNRLTDMASFGHLLHLEELDISDNQIESLTHLSCLKHLHTLKADRNAISSLDGIDKLRGMTHLSLSGNRLRGVHLGSTVWTNLETLDVSHNQLIAVRGLSAMRRLKSVNLDHNELGMVDLMPSMPKLRVLRVSGNVQLSHLDVGPALRLRTLYADYCDLSRIENLHLLQHLDNLSMRQQAEAAIVWPADQLRDVRRLFLSGNAFPAGISSSSGGNLGGSAVPGKDEMSDRLIGTGVGPALSHPLRFLNLVYLELAACQLTTLPQDLAEMAPNLRSLNLDHNLISTLPELGAMQRLKRLSVVGCRIKKSKSIIRAVRGLAELQVLDARTNPCTLGLYAPLVVPATLPGHHQTASGGGKGLAMAMAMAVSGAASLPPIPNAHVVQPDRASYERRQEERKRKSQQEMLEKSFFHKRQPPAHDYAVATPTKLHPEHEGRKGEGALVSSSFAASDLSSLFEAADQRFVKTLPHEFRERRILHRGLLAMACPKLNWIDGLLISQDDIEDADRLVLSRRFERTP
ncbi:hypothetical protein BCV70DRAFT_199825 [Testicularia cyperi]|uniref:L domain-like protein n=1 Tax=Testicularia cyperi TaxID=1882483 RepID=A0A317XRY4_9BASI|nr:hypothetical protein BCV70DRAFT_199825 [Testicularia cyperi]